MFKIFLFDQTQLKIIKLMPKSYSCYVNSIIG